MFSKYTVKHFFILIAALMVFIGIPTAAKDVSEIILRIDDFNGSQPPDSPAKEVIIPPAKPHVPAPNIKAASAVLMDLRTGQVLYEKNGRVRRPNASTTKIMTAILMIENLRMDEMIKASKRASETPYTSIHLQPEEEISARDLLIGMMVRSANDAAVAAAEHIAGSVQKFAIMMNAKAAEIGCRDTNFVTPNGLYDPNHYSTAYDLCLMAKYALRYPLFNEVITIRKHALSSRTKNRKDLVVFSKNKFLKEYPGADGVKSGYIKQAGYCYVGSATRNNWRLVSAVLKSDNASRDTAALMDYGFNNFEPYTIVRAEQKCGKAEVRGGAADSVDLVPARDLVVVVPKSGAKVITKLYAKPISAPVEPGMKVGAMAALVNGVEVSRVELRAASPVEISFGRKLWSWAKISGLFFACIAVGGKYGATVAKNTRRRRARLTAPLRDYNSFR